MRHQQRLFLIVFALGTVSAWAQQHSHAEVPDLLARLSYERSPISDNAVRQVCIAVSREGNYRIFLSTNAANGPIRLQGKMTEDQFQQLKKLLAEPAFRSLPGSHGGLIREQAENFVAEIPQSLRQSGDSPLESALPHPRRMQWLNADDESPFPVPMAKIIDWMNHFEPKDAQPFDGSEISDVCPSVGLSLIQPSVATNEHP